MKIVKANGVDYIVHYSINSLVELEKATGKPFTDLFDNEEGVSLTALRRIIFYGLKAKQHEMSEEKAGVIIDQLIEGGMSIMDISAAFLEELTQALGMKKEENTSPNA